MPQDRIAGSLVGLAVGDALGAGYEFASQVPDEPQMIGGGLGGWEPGEWTDDTQMAISIAEVTAAGNVDSAQVGERFLEWFRGHPKDVGIQIGAVLRRSRSGSELHSVSAEYFRRNPDRAAGNGSLMRTAPVALANLGDDEAIRDSAMAISALTHGDPQTGEACVLWCIGIDRAIRESRLDGVRDGLKLLEPEARDRWSLRIEEAESSPPATFAPNGFVVKAFQAAYSAVSRTRVPDGTPWLHLQEALKAAVRVGDDTDTVAAIAGSLLGARWGVVTVPFRWRRLLHGWPGYRTQDLVRLAVLSASEGTPDRNGWPIERSLVSYYRREFGVRGVVVPLEDDPSVLVGDVGGLEGVGGDADVVVSLCRVGTHDAQRAPEHNEVWLIDKAGATPNLDFVLTDTAEGISAARDEGKTVFIHCVRGESRTPTIAAAYLAHRFGMSAEEALSRVRRVLPNGQPKQWFREALAGLWPSASGGAS